MTLCLYQEEEENEDDQEKKMALTFRYPRFYSVLEGMVPELEVERKARDSHTKRYGTRTQ